MRVVDGIINDVLGQISHIISNLFPWLWDNKFWIFALIPVIVVIIIVKYIWD